MTKKHSYSSETVKWTSEFFAGSLQNIEGSSTTQKKLSVFSLRRSSLKVTFIFDRIVYILSLSLFSSIKEYLPH